MISRFAFVSIAAAIVLGACAGGVSAAKLTGAQINAAGGLKMALPPGSPRYIFKLNGMTISHTRSLHEDTDYVTAGVTGLPNQVKAMGNLNDGDYMIALSFNAGVGPSDSVSLSYVVLNTAKPAGSVSAALQEAALDVGQNFGLNLTGLLTGGCDGIVAKGRHTFTGAQLAAQTAGGRVIAGNDFTPGTDSATGCGSNSKYSVQWTISGTQ